MPAAFTRAAIAAASPEQRARWAAEAVMGWQWSEENQWWYGCGAGDWIRPPYRWQPQSDYAHAAELRAAVAAKGLGERFVHELDFYVIPGELPFNRTGIFAFMNATPAQQLEAALRCVAKE